jgi:hypothetical protein
VSEASDKLKNASVMKKIMLLLMLMVAFVSFSPVEKGDQLKTSPMVGYTVSALTGNYETTIQDGAILNYCTDMTVDIAAERYRHELTNNSLHYSNIGYPIDKNDNFTRWLICYPERSSLPHNKS